MTNQNGESKKFTREEVIRLAEMMEPKSIYNESGDRLLQPICEIVNKFMFYDDFMHITNAMSLNDPDEIKANINEANLVELIMFLKFLITKVKETNGDAVLTAVSEYVILAIQKEMESRNQA